MKTIKPIADKLDKRIKKNVWVTMAWGSVLVWLYPSMAVYGCLWLSLSFSNYLWLYQLVSVFVPEPLREVVRFSVLSLPLPVVSG